MIKYDIYMLILIMYSLLQRNSTFEPQVTSSSQGSRLTFEGSSTDTEFYKNMW